MFDRIQHIHYPNVQKVLPAVYGDELSYYELLAKFEDKINNLITLANELGVDVAWAVDAMKNIADLPEIDAKVQALQETANAIQETLDALPSYSQFTDMQNELNIKPFVFDTVAEMQNSTLLSVGEKCITLGFYTANDGGGGLYTVRNNTPNGIDALQCVHGTANLIYTDSINARMLGANDLIDCSSIFNYVLTDLRKSLYIPKGTYHISTPIILTENSEIYGDSNTSTIIECLSDTPAILKPINDDAPYIKIQDMALRTSITNSHYAIELYGTQTAPYTGCRYSTIRNIIINGYYGGIFINSAWSTTFENIRCMLTEIGVRLGGGCNDFTLKRIIVGDCNRGIYIASSEYSTTESTSIMITECDIERAAQAIRMESVFSCNILNLYSENVTNTLIYLYSCKAVNINGIYYMGNMQVPLITGSTGSLFSMSGLHVTTNNDNNFIIVSTDARYYANNINILNHGNGICYLDSRVKNNSTMLCGENAFIRDSISKRLRYSDDTIQYNMQQRCPTGQFMLQSAYLVIDNDVSTLTGDTFTLRFNGTAVGTLYALEEHSYSKGDRIQFTLVSASDNILCFNRGTTISLTHSNTVGVDMLAHIEFTNVISGEYIF